MENLCDLPESISHVLVNGKNIYIIGTAHVSKESVQDVKTAVTLLKPDSICVELCESRYKTITNRDHWKNMNIFKVIKEGNAMLLLSSLILSSFQKRIGNNLGAAAGAEMIEGISQCKKTGAALVLADRNIQVTLKRTWRHLNFWNKAKMLFQLIFSLFSFDEIDDEMINELKKTDQLDSILKEFSDGFPSVKKTLIDERDMYLSHKIKNAPGDTVIAILGAGHCPGVKKHMDEEIDIDKITTLPPPSKLGKIIAWSIPLLIIGLLIYGFFSMGTKHSVESIYIWVFLNGVLSALGALIAFGHPLTVLSAFVAAPITSLNPMIAAGWVSGLVQAWIKKPTVAHLESLPEEILTVKGFWKNPVTRILLVICMSNLGSALGTFISGSWIAARVLGTH